MAVYLQSFMKNGWRWIPEEEVDGRAWRLTDGEKTLGDVVTYPGEARYFACDYVGFSEIEYASMQKAAAGLLERLGSGDSSSNAG